MNKIIKMLSFAALMLGFVTSPDVSIASPGNTQLPPPPTRALQLPPPPPPPAMTASSVATQRQIQLPPPPPANPADADKMLDESIKKGDFNGVETAVHYGACVNEGTVDKAVSAGFVKIADYLIEKVGVPRIQSLLNTGSKKILTHAIGTGNNDMIHLMLVKCTYSVNAPWNDRGESALQVALGMDASDDVIFALLKLGAYINCGEGESTPLYKAARAGRVELVKKFLAYGAVKIPGILECARWNHIKRTAPQLFSPGQILFQSVSDEPSFSSDSSLSQSRESTPEPKNDDQATSEIPSSSIDSTDPKKSYCLTGRILDALLENPFIEVPGMGEDDTMFGELYQVDIDLFRAIKRGDLVGVQAAISNGADVNCDYLNPLIRAVEANNKAIIDMLVQNGAKVDDAEGKALKTAIDKNNFDIVQHLVDVHHANVNAINIFGRSLLSRVKAQVPQNKEIIDFLVKHGAVDIDFSQAIEKGDLKGVNAAISHGVNVNDHILDPLARAVKANNKAIIDTLIQNGANVDEDNGIALRTAIENNNLDMVKYLVDVYHASVNVDVFGHSLLSLAKEHVPQNKEIIDFLVKHGAVDMDLLQAIAKGDLQEVNAAISHGVHLNYSNFSLLIRAVEANNKAIIDILVQNGAKVDDVNGIALRIAVANNNFDIVQHLVDVHHANVNVVDVFGNSLLSLAKEQVPQNKEIIDFLVKRGAKEKTVKQH